MADLEITTFSVRLKLTKEIQPGTPDEAADWRRAQRDLYADLKGQLGALWSVNGNGHGPRIGQSRHNGGGK